jgi:hypothetical protein
MLPFIPEVFTLQSLLDPLSKNALPILGSLGGIAAASQLVRLGRFVPEENVAVRKVLGAVKNRGGEVYGILGPGLHGRIPIYSDLQTVFVGYHTDDIELIIQRNDVQHLVGALATWGVLCSARKSDGSAFKKRTSGVDVMNAIKAATKPKDEATLTRAVAGSCRKAIREVMEDELPSDNFRDSDSVEVAVKEKVNHPLEQTYGVGVYSLQIGTLALTAPQVLGEKVQDAMSVIAQAETVSDDIVRKAAGVLIAAMGAQSILNGRIPA